MKKGGVSAPSPHISASGIASNSASEQATITSLTSPSPSILTQIRSVLTATGRSPIPRNPPTSTMSDAVGASATVSTAGTSPNQTPV